MPRELRSALLALLTATMVILCAAVGFGVSAQAEDGGETSSCASTTDAASEQTGSATDDCASGSSTTSTTTAGTTTSTASTSASATSSDVPDSAFEVSNASLRWGINNESNNKAFAPGTYNFLSAGKIGNPGSGGQTLTDASKGGTWSNGTSAGWKQKAGNVSLEKYITGSGYEKATWAGLKTDSDGTAISSATSGQFSNHQVVLVGGTGQVDPDNGTASIRWKGSFTVVYYSGYVFFYVTNPRLTVKNGKATLTATLGGYGSSMDDMTTWKKLDDTVVTLANLGKVDLGADLGFTKTPAYRKVKITVAKGYTAQVRSGDDWGSFPQSFVDFQQVAGSSSYWYSSGGSTDANKPALPLSVSYRAGNPVSEPTPTSTITSDPVDNPVNSASSTPTATAPIPTTGSAPTTSSTQSEESDAETAVSQTPSSLVGAGTSVQAGGPQTTVFPNAVPASAEADDQPLWAWWVGAIALGSALAVVVRTLLTGWLSGRRGG
ncbi:MAG: HtaA domain-containing protein [Nocardioides sp.]|uniref:hypothetical protein n=1 Tax=Nocardioides sp. TaxID=35761 RepID=UPI0039E6B71A